MIKKEYRLKENEVKKVLRIGKPFFSYGLVLNKNINKLGYNRFAIVIGGKSVKDNITRNFFRRRFYDRVFNLTSLHLIKGAGGINQFYDMVFVTKKQTKFDKKDSVSIDNFNKDLNFLINKI